MSTYQKPCYMNKQEFEAWCYRLFTTFCKDIGWTTKRVTNYIEANIVQEYTDTFDVPGNPIVVYFAWDESFIRVTNIITGKTGVAKLKDGEENDYIIGLALAYARYTKTRIPILVLWRYVEVCVCVCARTCVCVYIYMCVYIHICI